MGLMDNFSSDGTVTMKHAEYYNLMHEAAKCELLTNAINADVPHSYIKGMLTGKKEKNLDIPIIMSESEFQNIMERSNKDIEPQNKDTIPGLTVEIECKTASKKNKGDKNVNITN